MKDKNVNKIDDSSYENKNTSSPPINKNNLPPQKDLSKLFGAKLTKNGETNLGQDEAPPGESIENEENIVIQETSHLPTISREEIALDQIIHLQGKDFQMSKEEEQSEVQKQVSILDKTDFKKSQHSKNDGEQFQMEMSEFNLTNR